MSIVMLALTAPVAVSVSADDVYSCEHVGRFDNGPHDPIRKDMTLVRSGAPMELGTWTITWPDGEAKPIVVLGSGFGLALRIPDKKGKMRRASFVAGDNVPVDGSKYAWLNFGEPSPFQSPGYFCATKPAREKELVQ